MKSKNRKLDWCGRHDPKSDNLPILIIPDETGADDDEAEVREKLELDPPPPPPPPLVENSRTSGSQTEISKSGKQKVQSRHQAKKSSDKMKMNQVTYVHKVEH